MECRPMIPSSLFIKWSDCLCLSTVSTYTSCYFPYRDCSELFINECDVATTKCACPTCKRLVCYACRWRTCGCDLRFSFDSSYMEEITEPDGSASKCRCYLIKLLSLSHATNNDAHHLAHCLTCPSSGSQCLALLPWSSGIYAHLTLALRDKTDQVAYILPLNRYVEQTFAMSVVHKIVNISARTSLLQLYLY
ncbi:hypothetical protein SASPL_105328 [Salvia splendens]|uniref:Uncharacterized protein n=1 Tax=Salvia splendens TaxID=180675 RepID=A0A8X8YQ92_SALSN|nr:hypothetical protein SASPL_105328 [Salvia splendens]